MYILPIELYLFLALIIPLGICFAKWQYSSNWKITIVICAVLSWIYFNGMMMLYPPDNGFASFIYIFTGWFWLLPVFMIFRLLFYAIQRKITLDAQYKSGIRGLKVCYVLTGLILFWNFFGNMNESRAIKEARYQLEKRGYIIKGSAIPEYDSGYWIIRYPDSDFGEIRLTKNGRMSWIGGPR